MSQPSDSNAFADISTAEAYRRRIAELEARLAEAEETLDAIRSGEVDAVVVGDADDRRVFTLESADRPYRRLIEEMREGALTLSVDGIVLYCNVALAELLRTPPERVMGARFATFVANEEASFAAVLDNGGNTEITLRAADGGLVPAKLSLSELPMDDDRVMCGVVTDLTETQAHARELGEAQAGLAIAAARRESDERYRLAARATNDAIWDWHFATDRVGWNEAVEAAYGHALPDGASTSAWWLAHIHPDDRARVDREIHAVIDGTVENWADEYRFRRADGSYADVFDRGHLIRAADGRAIRMIGAMLDLTERKRAEAHLRQLNDTLESRVAAEVAERAKTEEQLRQSQKVEALGQLTGGIAHDFNNLLTVIRSSADLLRRRELPEEKRRRYVDAISDTADRAAKLTGQLLAFARRQALKAEVFDACGRVDAIADMLRTLLGSRIELAIEVWCDSGFVEADAGQFETALVNMAVNARDAMNGEGRLTIFLKDVEALPTVRGHAGAPGEFLAVSVSDTGLGIAPADLDRIFEPFFTTKGVGKGTGLGLSQVYGFAKQTGGDIDVTSEPGCGTTFTLYLPRAERPGVVAAAGGTEEHAGGRGRVLVVEDNAQVGEFAAQLLEDLGYDTAFAANAQEALDLIERESGAFDLVFSDVVMPGIGGVEFGRRVRELWPGVPVVLTSGYSHVLAEDARHGFPLLHKPYSVEDLSRILRQAAAR